MNTYQTIQSFLGKKATTCNKVVAPTELECKNFECNGVKISHTTPRNEPINAGDKITFEAIEGRLSQVKINMYVTVNCNQVVQESTLTYYHHEDIFIGEKLINKIHYQLILRMIDFSNDGYLLQLTYHDLSDVFNARTTHNGTIHPWT